MLVTSLTILQKARSKVLVASLQRDLAEAHILPVSTIIVMEATVELDSFSFAWQSITLLLYLVSFPLHLGLDAWRKNA